jgi:hypothetical protein
VGFPPNETALTGMDVPDPINADGIAGFSQRIQKPAMTTACANRLTKWFGDDCGGGCCPGEGERTSTEDAKEEGRRL